MTHLDKHAMHMVRLYYTTFDILEKGQIINRRDREYDELMAIRGGKYHRADGSYAPEFFEMVDGLEARLKRDAQETFLPEKPDIGKIEELLMAMNMTYLKRIL